jgi:hypothetical protein
LELVVKAAGVAVGGVDTVCMLGSADQANLDSGAQALGLGGGLGNAGPLMSAWVA